MKQKTHGPSEQTWQQLQHIWTTKLRNWVSIPIVLVQLQKSTVQALDAEGEVQLFMKKFDGENKNKTMLFCLLFFICIPNLIHALCKRHGGLRRHLDIE